MSSPLLASNVVEENGQQGHGLMTNKTIEKRSSLASIDTEKEEPLLSNVATEIFDFEVELDKLIRSIWNYVYSYTDSPPMQYSSKIVLAVLRKAIELFEAETTVLDLKVNSNTTLLNRWIQKVICIVGDIQGQADTLISLLSTLGLPPYNTYLFLGNYGGQGFGPHECLLLLLALKVRYPKYVYLLKGCLEDPEVLKANEFIEGLIVRNLMNTSMVWLHFEKLLNVLPWAAVLANNYLCVHGGIGPQLIKHGLKALRKCRRPAVYPLELAIEQECLWSCYRGPLVKTTGLGFCCQAKYTDGAPLFSDADVKQFLEQNNLQLLIRSKQIVIDGVLNLPPRMFTVFSAAGLLDQFRNIGAVLIVDAEKRLAAISRIRILEDEPKSLDDVKPAAGRNAIIL